MSGRVFCNCNLMVVLTSEEQLFQVDYRGFSERQETTNMPNSTTWATFWSNSAIEKQMKCFVLVHSIANKQTNMDDTCHATKQTLYYSCLNKRPNSSKRTKVSLQTMYVSSLTLTMVSVCCFSFVSPENSSFSPSSLQLTQADTLRGCAQCSEQHASRVHFARGFGTQCLSGANFGGNYFRTRRAPVERWVWNLTSFIQSLGVNTVKHQIQLVNEEAMWTCFLYLMLTDATKF